MHITFHEPSAFGNSLDLFLAGLPMWNGTPTSWNDATVVGWARALINAHAQTAPQEKGYKGKGKAAAYAPYPSCQYLKGGKKPVAGQPPPRRWRKTRKHGGISTSS